MTRRHRVKKQNPGRIDAGKYAVLAAAYQSEDATEGTRVINDVVNGYRSKVVIAGDFLYISAYPLIGANVNREQRKRLEEMSLGAERCAKLRAKYARFNSERRIREFEQLVHANMKSGDLHIVCTYDTQDFSIHHGLTSLDRDAAKNNIRNYLRRVKRLLKKNGYDVSEFRWICCTVTKERTRESTDPLPDTHHHHLLVHGVPESMRNDIENLWNFGYCNADRIKDSAEGLARLARYVAKQERSAKGERGFTCSRNIIRPRVTTCDNKISRARVSKIAADVQSYGSEIFEKLFKGYRVTEAPKVLVSDFVAGAYIYARMRRIEPRGVVRMRGAKGKRSEASARFPSAALSARNAA